MSLVPDTIQGKIDFYRSKNTPWAEHHAAIGTTAAAVTGVATRVTTAQAKLDAQIALRAALKAATEDLHLAVRDLLAAGGDVVKQVRAKAAVDGPGVYVLAEIPAPAVPTPVPPPGTPTGFTVAIRQDGALVLRWKCPNPARSYGTVYQVSRRLGAGGPMVMLGASGRREFADATLPTAAAQGDVTYQVQAIRSTSSGLPALFTVRFGVDGGGAVTAMVATAGARLAA